MLVALVACSDGTSVSERLEGPSQLGVESTWVMPSELPLLATSQADALQASPIEMESAAREPQPCPDGMVRARGEYCPALAGGDHRCLRWMDPPNAIARRCAEYAPGTTCRGATTSLDFCIDRYEFVEEDSTLPMTDVSWRQARALCEAENKRLCTTDEWTFACEGPERLPHPYGYVRSSALCNMDRTALVRDGELIDQRVSIYDHPDCVSPFGVQHMTGNVGEWTVDPKRHAPFRSAGKGGWWGPLRNRCRATTGGHDEHFHQIQIGFRCCSDTP
jgi:hypothetical protein